jgi:hypothetical protein
VEGAARGGVFGASMVGSDPVGILEYKCFFYVILYFIILFDIEIDIKIRFIFCVHRNSVFIRFSMVHID